MELINLSRVLPNDIINEIERLCRTFADGEVHTIEYGQLIIGSAPASVEIKVDLVINAVCDFYGIERGRIMVRSRRQPYLRYRQTIMWLIEAYTKLSHAEIGRQTGGYDHATVCHSIKVVNNYFNQDKKIQSELIRIDNKIKKIFNNDNHIEP